jgi:signal transduction histidine kinase
MGFLDIQFIGPLVAGLLGFAIGGFTFFHDRKNATHRYFFATTGVVTIWACTIAIFHLPGNENSSLWWNLHWIAGLFMAPLVLFTLKNFPHRELRIHPYFRIAAWAGGGILALLVVLWPQNFIQYYVVEANKVPEVAVGRFAWVYEVYFGTYFVLSFFFIIRTFLRTYGNLRAQILAGIVGLAIGMGGASFTNLTLSIHFGVELIWLGPIFGVISTTSFSYMIFGVRGGRTRLFPISILGIAVVLVLALQMAAAERIEDVILNGAILAGTVLLVTFLVRDTLLEAADAKRFQDISHRLQRANEDLKRADRVKSEFLAIVSHHLRTPLTHIKWALTELAEGNYGKKLEPEQQKLTKDLLANNERLVNFIESFMDTSHIETGKITLEKESISIDAMLKDLAEACKDRANNYYRVDIEFLPSAEEIPRIIGDKESLNKVFENILENALLYNKPGGKIYIKTEKAGSNVKIEIADTGIGIAAEELKRVGEKFFRSSRAKSHVAEGTGLGVFITKHIVLLHGGKLEIRSKAKEGTIVQVVLPISQK